MIDPRRCACMAGRKARMVVAMASTFRFQLRLKSCAVVSRMVPLATQPAQFTSTSTSLFVTAASFTATSSVTSSTVRRALVPA